jgi:hypothetical protein
MLAKAWRFAQRIHQQGSVEQAVLDAMSATVRPAIQQNLASAAASQLKQFRAGRALEGGLSRATGTVARVGPEHS